MPGQDKYRDPTKAHKGPELVELVALLCPLRSILGGSSAVAMIYLGQESLRLMSPCFLLQELALPLSRPTAAMSVSSPGQVDQHLAQPESKLVHAGTIQLPVTVLPFCRLYAITKGSREGFKQPRHGLVRCNNLRDNLVSLSVILVHSAQIRRATPGITREDQDHLEHGGELHRAAYFGWPTRLSFRS